jgi:hypothetical protein
LTLSIAFLKAPGDINPLTASMAQTDVEMFTLHKTHIHNLTCQTFATRTEIMALCEPYRLEWKSKRNAAVVEPRMNHRCARSGGAMSRIEHTQAVRPDGKLARRLPQRAESRDGAEPAVDP